MKLFTLMQITALSVTFWACTKNNSEAVSTPYLRANVSQLTVNGNAGTLDSLLIESNTKWNLSLTSSSGWVTLDRTSGNGNSKVYLTIKEDNITDAARIATLTISTDNNAAPALSLELKQGPSKPVKPFNLAWNQLYGGTANDEGFVATATAEGGLVIAGNTTSSNNGDMPLNNGGIDGVIIKLSATGSKQWIKTVGGSNNEVLEGITPTTDGGYLVCGITASNTLPGYNGGASDGYLARLDANGNLVWQKPIGSLLNDQLMAVTPAHDGGYLLTGYTGTSTNYDVWIVKIDDNGAVVWEKKYGGTANDLGYALVKSAGSGYVIAASSESNNGDVAGAHGQRDGWVLKIDNAGAIEWKKTIGGSQGEELLNLKAVSTGYILAGFTASNDGDVSGNHGNGDVWLVKLGLNGNLEWQKCFGGTDSDIASSITVTPDEKHYFLAAVTQSTNGQVTSNFGGGDGWVLQVSNQGNLVAQQTFGGTSSEIPNSILMINASEYIVAGTSSSKEGNFSTNKGSSDIWAFKFKLP